MVFFVYVGECVVYEMNVIVLNICFYYFGCCGFQVFVIVSDDQVDVLQVLICEGVQKFVLEYFGFGGLYCDVQYFFVFVGIYFYGYYGSDGDNFVILLCFDVCCVELKVGLIIFEWVVEEGVDLVVNIGIELGYLVFGYIGYVYGFDQIVD